MNRVLLLFSILLSIFSQAQNFAPPIQHFGQNDYGDNLNPVNYCITQDTLGVMYFGNVGAIIKYDGQSWDTISVEKGKAVRSIHNSKRNKIYIGSANDFGLLEPNFNGKLRYKSLRSLLKNEIEFQEILNITSINHLVYFQAQEAIFIYNELEHKVNIVRPENPNHTFHSAFSVNGTYLVRQRKVGILKLRNDKLELLHGSSPFKIYGIFGAFSRKNDAVIITNEVGFWKYQNNQISPLYDTTKNPEKQSLIEQLNHLWMIGGIELQNGNLLVTSDITGVTEVDKSGNIIKRLSKTNGLKSNSIYAAYQGINGEVWLATKKGISKVNYNDPISYYGENRGLSGGVNDMAIYYNQLFVATDEGLFYKSNTESNFHAADLPKMKINDLKIYNEMVYMATSAGLIEFDPFMNSYSIKSYFQSNALFIDTAHTKLVLAGDRGIQVLALEDFKQFDLHEMQMSTVLGIRLSDKPSNCDYEYWIGSMNGAIRLSYFDGFGFTKHYGENAGLESGIVKPMYLGKELVFGSGEGLLRFVNEQEMVETGNISKEEADGYFDLYNFKNGVIPQNVYIFSATKSGADVWLGGANEVLEIKNETLDARAKLPFTNRINGIISEMISDNNMVYIGTSEGVYTYKIKNEKNYQLPFHTFFNSIVINEKDTILNGHIFSNLKNEFPYKENDLTFSYSTSEYGASSVIMFRYKLEGRSDDWSTWKLDRKVPFTNLDEGTYTLIIQGKNQFGVLGSEAIYKFTILPPWYRTWWAYVLFVIAAILILILAMTISAKRLKQKNKELEAIVTERTREIASQRDEILEQKTEIEDSINYAVRIQEAMLPFQEEIYKSFPEHFVLFKPKDVVSGDFYWHAKKDHYSILVCADCTGHGVPGAFMSMIGSDKLSHAVAEYNLFMPDDLLSFVNQGIKTALKQDETSENATRDGMDVAIITHDTKENKLYYAAANRSLMVLENDEVTEIKATKVAVGGFTPMDQKFELHQVEINPNRTFYMTTDGYADQFGGEKGKKLKVKAMKKVMIENGAKSMNDQKQALNATIETWMEGHEQIDDICVIGVRFTSK